MDHDRQPGPGARGPGTHRMGRRRDADAVGHLHALRARAPPRRAARERLPASQQRIVAVNDALTKHLFDNRYGTGQSALDGAIRATNIPLAGRVFTVIGYGWCGRGLALRAKGHGARVLGADMDMSFANQALSAAWLAEHGRGLAAAVNPVPQSIDEEVARLKLAALGMATDMLTEEPTAYLSSWEEGT